MHTDIGKLLEDMRGIQEQLEQFFEDTHEKFRYTLEDGRARFSREVQQLQRRDYLVNDRHRLAYLNSIEKINCTYCGYGNGVVAYAREIISQTEQYWCPVHQANRVKDAHRRYLQFFPFGDARGYHQGLAGKRQALRESRLD